MKHLLDTALRKYDESDLVTQMKARFFFFLCLIIIVILPVMIVYTAYLNLHNPTLDYRINFNVVIPEIIATVIIIALLALLIRGHFTISSHIFIFTCTVTIWIVMAFDRSHVVSRLDTISFLFVVLTLAPLAATRKGTAIITYGVVNIALLIVYAYIFEEQFNIRHSTLIDYVADNSISLVLLSVTSFSSFAINRRALNRAEKELSERLKAEDALQESEERYRMLFESSREAIVIIEAGTWDVVDINIGAFDMFRIDREIPKETITGKWDMAPELQPDGRPSREMIMEMLQKAMRDGWCFYEFRLRRTTGEEFPATVLLSKCVLQNRTLIQATMRDVTERKTAEEQIKKSLREKEVLLKEIHHRVKNNFQIIISLLNLQSGGINDADLLRLFNESTNRIRAMALVHEKLYQSENISDIAFSAYLRTISEELYTSYASGPLKPELVIESEDIYLGIDQAIPCGLILNELLTNSLKYAFPESGSDNIINITMHASGAGDIILAISDNGIGLPENIDIGKISSLGLQLVSVLIKQIHGNYQIDRRNGTSWVVTFPARNPSVSK
jgi:PAS domain S-box-containing protein